MEKLDQSVLGALEQQIVAPERLSDLLSAFLERSDESDIRRREGWPCFVRQAYVRLLVDEVIVGEEQVKVRGSRKALASAAVASSENARERVPIFARVWCTQEGCNNAMKSVGSVG